MGHLGRISRSNLFLGNLCPTASKKTCLQTWVGPQINHCKLLMLIFWSGGALFLYIFGLGRLFLSCFLLQHLHCFFPFRFPFQASFGFIFLFPGFFSFDPFFFGRLLLSIWSSGRCPPKKELLASITLTWSLISWHFAPEMLQKVCKTPVSTFPWYVLVLYWYVLYVFTIFTCWVVLEAPGQTGTIDVVSVINFAFSSFVLAKTKTVGFDRGAHSVCELDLNTARTNKESNVVEKGHHFGSPCNLFSINLF